MCLRPHTVGPDIDRSRPSFSQMSKIPAPVSESRVCPRHAAVPLMSVHFILPLSFYLPAQGWAKIHQCIFPNT